MSLSKSPKQKDWQEQIEENLRSGLIELLILSTLYKEDMYVYDIKQRLEELSNGVFSISFGSMYRPLYRLLDRKLVSCYKKYVGEKRARVYYHLEESGIEYYTHYKKAFSVYFDAADKVLSEADESEAQA